MIQIILYDNPSTHIRVYAAVQSRQPPTPAARPSLFILPDSLAIYLLAYRGALDASRLLVGHLGMNVAGPAM